MAIHSTSQNKGSYPYRVRSLKTEPPLTPQWPPYVGQWLDQEVRWQQSEKEREKERNKIQAFLKFFRLKVTQEGGGCVLRKKFLVWQPL